MLVHEVAHWLEVAPLIPAVALRRRDPDRALLGLALGVSFLADWLPHLGVNRDVVGNTYPILQCGLVALALVDDGAAIFYAAALTAVAFVALGVQGPAGFDVLLRVFAWGSTVWIVQRATTGGLRASLLLFFGGGLFGWLLTVATNNHDLHADPVEWIAWGVYHAALTAGLLWFTGLAFSNRTRAAG